MTIFNAALFPTGRSGMYKITVADWRKDTTGLMQVVSGVMGKEKVHFQAPDSDVVEKEMARFINCQLVTRAIRKPGDVGNLNFCTFTQIRNGLTGWSFEIPADNIFEKR